MKTKIFFFGLIAFFISNFSDAQTITTIAGNGTAGYGGDGVAATSTGLHIPYAAITDTAGNIYIADAINARIRKVNTSGIISTIAGNGSSSYGGDGGAAVSASLNYPCAIAFDKFGNLYIADYFNARIRMVNTAGIISTIAGTGTTGFSGDGGPAIAATLDNPAGVAVDTFGNVYFADRTDCRIRKINTSGIISTVAGNGTPGDLGDGGAATSAEINYPFHIAIDNVNNLYICENGGHKIRKVTASGIISTIAGNGTAGYSGDGIAATAAELNSPCGVGVDASYNVYIADQSNNRIRKVNTAGVISTIAGTGSAAFSGDGGAATAANLNTPEGVFADAYGNVFIADANNSRIRKITSCLPSTGVISGFDSICVGATSALTESLSGGTWSSSDITVATIDSIGNVSAIAPGVDNITYTNTGSCGSASVVKSITVNPLPNAGSISGPDTVCTELTVILTDTVTGGTWSSTSTVATVSGSGAVMGIHRGIDTIKYTVTGSCGSSFAVKPIYVDSVPTLSSIIGLDSVCITHTITLSDSSSGGIWSSTDALLASVTSGIVFGLSVGLDTIIYQKTNGCGTTAIAHAVYVINTGCSTETDIANKNVALSVSPNPSKGILNFSGQFNSANEEIITIQIFNTLGQIVSSVLVQTVNGSLHYSLDIPKNIVNGIYLLQIRSNTESKNIPLAIER